MLLGEILFIFLGASFLVMLALGIFVAANLKHSKKEPIDEKEISPIIKEVEEKPIITMKITDYKQPYNVHVEMDPKTVIVDTPKYDKLPEINTPTSSILPESEGHIRNIDYRREIENEFYGLKEKLQSAETPFFDSVENDEPPKNFEEPRTNNPGIIACPHCKSDVPTTLYCIYCGQSLFRTLKKQVTTEAVISSSLKQ
jgi:hypothetical protein